MDQLFNMGGTAAYQADNGGTDPLLAAFQATCSSNCGPGNAEAGKPYADSFGWLSHTYDTPYLDVGCATQNYIEAELNENTSAAAAAIPADRRDRGPRPDPDDRSGSRARGRGPAGVRPGQPLRVREPRAGEPGDGRSTRSSTPI